MFEGEILLVASSKRQENLREDIHYLHRMIPELQAVARKQVHLQPASHGMAFGDQVPSPINFQATMLLDRLQVLATLLAMNAGLLFHTHMRIERLFDALDSPDICSKLERNRHVDDYRRLLDEARREVAAMLVPQDNLRFTGVCPSCGHGIWSDAERMPDGVSTCRTCGASVDLKQVWQAHVLKLITSNSMDTASGLARFLRANGYEVSRNLITQWGIRGRIDVHHDEMGNKVYRLSQVLLILLRERN